MEFKETCPDCGGRGYVTDWAHPLLNRLPFPSPSLLDDMAQPWEGKVKGKN